MISKHAITNRLGFAPENRAETPQGGRGGDLSAAPGIGAPDMPAKRREGASSPERDHQFTRNSPSRPQ